MSNQDKERQVPDGRAIFHDRLLTLATDLEKLIEDAPKLGVGYVVTDELLAPAGDLIRIANYVDPVAYPQSDFPERY